MYLAALHGGQVGGVARQLHQRSLSGQAPGAAQGIVFQPCARLLRQDKRVLAVAVACRRQPWHHALHKGEPVWGRCRGRLRADRPLGYNKASVRPDSRNARPCTCRRTTSPDSSSRFRRPRSRWAGRSAGPKSSAQYCRCRQGPQRGSSYPQAVRRLQAGHGGGQAVGPADGEDLVLLIAAVRALFGDADIVFIVGQPSVAGNGPGQQLCRGGRGRAGARRRVPQPIDGLQRRV